MSELRKLYESLAEFCNEKFISGFSQRNSENNREELTLVEEKNQKQYPIAHNCPFFALRLDDCYDSKFKGFKKINEFHINERCDYILVTQKELIFVELKSERVDRLFPGQLYNSQIHWMNVLNILQFVSVHILESDNALCNIFPSVYYYCFLSRIDKGRDQCLDVPKGKTNKSNIPNRYGNERKSYRNISYHIIRERFSVDNEGKCYRIADMIRKPESKPNE